jgi:hypothetical protein
VKDKRTTKNIGVDRLKINSGYAAGQLAKALTASTADADAATRERALLKSAKWSAALNGLLSGEIGVGSRQPLRDVPIWATLEVVTGGFATGALLANGDLRDHEKSLLLNVFDAPVSDARRLLNSYFLSEEGFAQMQALLNSACYDIDVPEEGALLVVAWLTGHGRLDDARGLLDEIAPYFPQLRFYPIPKESPRQHSSHVHLQNVEDVIANLKNVAPNKQILAQKENVKIWSPLYDRIVYLFLETVDGSPPICRIGADGKPLRDTRDRSVVEGGWPCHHYPQDWQARALAVLEEFKLQLGTHTYCTWPHRAKSSLAQLRGYLQCATQSPASLTSFDIGRIRSLLGRYVAKRDLPNSARCGQIREQQRQQVGGSTHYDIARQLITRLQRFPADTGLDSLDSVAQPFSSEEAAQTITPGTTVPKSLMRKVERCLDETLEFLVQKGIITSGETLARVLPQMSSNLQATGFADPALRHLYAGIYRAFRRRRSLLLLNLEKQVQIEELPWVAAIDRNRSRELPSAKLSRQALEDISALTISAFPQTIIPNKLLQEFQALAKIAGLDLPLVEEVAADIFMGRFSRKYLDAAKCAGRLLNGTLYARYYDIDYEVLAGITMPETKSTLFGRKHHDPLLLICESRAGVSYGSWDAAVNGMLVEQQQILTTQNLAVLFAEFNFSATLGDQLQGLSRHCFSWVCQRLQMKTDKSHARLIQLKAAAYAWRQMIFFLSVRPDTELKSFLLWAEKYLGDQAQDFQLRFAPAHRGLVLSASGQAMDSRARRFLGWSKAKHWMLHEHGSR